MDTNFITIITNYCTYFNPFYAVTQFIIAVKLWLQLDL